MSHSLLPESSFFSKINYCIFTDPSVRFEGEELARKGARADEMLEIMKSLWSGQMVDFNGQFFSFKKLEMLPAPKKNIPIYVAEMTKVYLQFSCVLGKS